jgi:hypothetical protein
MELVKKWIDNKRTKYEHIDRKEGNSPAITVTDWVTKGKGKLERAENKVKGYGPVGRLNA